MSLFADWVPSASMTFQRVRAMLEESGGVQAGVLGAGDLKVSQRAVGGANQSVDVATGAGWVDVTTGTRNGLAHVYSDAIANVALAASNATTPRVDQLVVRYNDTSIPTGSGNTPTLEVVTGTPTAGATLDNRTGAVTGTALNDTLRLADIL